MTDETEDIKPQADDTTATDAAAESPADGTTEKSAAAGNSAPAEGVTESAAATESEAPAEAAASDATAEAENAAGGSAESAPKRTRKPRAKEAAESAGKDEGESGQDGGAVSPEAALVEDGAASGEKASASVPEKVVAAPKSKAPKGTKPGEAPVVRAQAKYVRTSARKARLVCDNVRGKSVVEARAILTHTPRAAARDWSKLLESAVANAEHNHELVGEDLVIKSISADEGPTMKRFRPRAQGRAARIRKRTAHLTILLTPKN
jgi:ribosomal protein L22